MSQQFLVLLRHEKKLLLLLPYSAICFYFYLIINHYTYFSFLEDSFIFAVFIYPIYLIYHYAITEYHYGSFTQIRMKKRIKDADALNIVFTIIDHDSKGLSIGAMTSQVFAIFYLNDLPQKRQKKILKTSNSKVKKVKFNSLFLLL